ncbi:hypothetical protein K493DRAFT_312428 [Basidiobolus meristosporus CBS 931.73]|uniref:Uncharacterized protein n=1 Tax=Basidiobolus meristosporus CBS 931.73 TaxID=1314790 RepID=A0A1Y1YUF9_9FUNG|nr:hypothetical protein K493DRAFT_312428 [Basidiobolus meristosporus CBS 931.73]|eukprot:ORY01474.1 hypothetical protein K493DRAFT_312428 [Basidiobolus meristosporus CBS 931.73]
MDSDWCTVCGKHVEVSGQLYCDLSCRQKDQQSNFVDPESPGVSPTASLMAYPSEQPPPPSRYPFECHSPNEAFPTQLGYPYHLKLYKKSTAFLPVDQRLFSLVKRYPPIRPGRRLLTVAQ